MKKDLLLPVRKNRKCNLTRKDSPLVFTTELCLPLPFNLLLILGINVLQEFDGLNV